MPALFLWRTGSVIDRYSSGSVVNKVRLTNSYICIYIRSGFFHTHLASWLETALDGGIQVIHVIFDSWISTLPLIMETELSESPDFECNLYFSMNIIGPRMSLASMGDTVPKCCGLLYFIHVYRVGQYVLACLLKATPSKANIHMRNSNLKTFRSHYALVFRCVITVWCHAGIAFQI